MFKKKPNTVKREDDYRIYKRVSSTHYKAFIKGEEVTINNISEGGIQIRGRRENNRLEYITIRKGNRDTVEYPAVLIWEKNNTAGYQFKTNVRIAKVDDRLHHTDRPRTDGSTIRRVLGM